MNPRDNHWVERRGTLDSIAGMPPQDKNRQCRDFKSIPHDESFAAFCEKHPAWADRSTSFVFFRDHPAFGGDATDKVLIQRQQLFGTCAVHAPVVLQHYLVAMANPGKATPTVDINKWLRKKATADILDGVIFGKGVDSTQVLERILVQGSFPGSRIPQALFDEVELVLERYGPLLAPMWRVTKDFHGAATRHLRPVSSHVTVGNTVGGDAFHSMLIVGSRRVSPTGVAKRRSAHKPSDKTRLLLQNWWEKKQFVEVDEGYYNACMGELAHYVITKQPRIPRNLDTTRAPYSISTSDGAGVSGCGPGPSRSSSSWVVHGR
jgi:hypothetical protein